MKFKILLIIKLNFERDFYIKKQTVL
jgi:hypothetical protein